MNIKAIETIYKGYRFRSRLEARWAVFFDEAGIDWQYEVEGFELPSGRYLPDFMLPKLGMHVEIKPPPFIWVARPKIYMAGRMANATCYRPFNIDVNHDTCIETVFGKTEIKYVGPFRDTSDHGMLRHHDARYSDSLDNVFARSLSGIGQCDIFFALFEDMEAFGTLVELGVAKQAKKKIIIGIPEEFPDVPDREVVDDCYYAHRSKSISDNLWFAIKAADECFVGSRNTVLGQFGDWLNAKYALPREQMLCKELSEVSEHGVSAICYGDPVEALLPDSSGIDLGGLIEFHHGHSLAPNRSILFRDFSKIREAAFSGRQARFKHGQSGAP